MDNMLHVKFTDGELKWVNLEQWNWKNLGVAKKVELEERSDKLLDSETELDEEDASSDGEHDVDLDDLVGEVISMYFDAGRKGWYNATVVEARADTSEIRVQWHDGDDVEWEFLHQWKWKYGYHGRMGGRIEGRMSVNRVGASDENRAEQCAKEAAQARRNMSNVYRFFLDHFREQW